MTVSRLARVRLDALAAKLRASPSLADRTLAHLEEAMTPKSEEKRHTFTHVRVPNVLLAQVEETAQLIAKNHPRHRGEVLGPTALITRIAIPESLDRLRAECEPDTGPAGARVTALLSELGAEEREVLAMLAARLLEGQRRYGRLDVASDARDFERERGEELADALVYGAIHELRRVYGKRKGRR